MIWLANSAETACWSMDGVEYRPTSASRSIINGVSLEIPHRRMTTLLGPNGAGKTTLLRLLLGELAPRRGLIVFRDRRLADWTRRDFARTVGVVPQGETEPLFTVREVVAMGRYPHLGPWQRERARDANVIDRAMTRCDVAQFADRWVGTLSGGEQQRVRLARALAQEPSVLVLDEPTASLDIRHEMTTFESVSRLRDEGVTVLLVTHNLNLAARYSDTLVLMNEGKIAAHGSPSDVITAAQVEATYDWPIDITRYSDGAPQVIPRSSHE